MYSGNNAIIQEKYNGATLIETRFNIITGGNVLGHIRKVYGTSENYEFFYLDNLGSRRVVLDNAGAVLDKFTYSAYGEVTHDSGSNSYLASFTGKEYDDTGFIYFNARYFDPVLGRFLTEDSVRDGVNYYNYCWNNPINFTDPDGHRFDDDLDVDYDRIKDKRSPEEDNDRDYEPRDPGKDLRDLKEAEKGLNSDIQIAKDLSQLEKKLELTPVNNQLADNYTKYAGAEMVAIGAIVCAAAIVSGTIPMAIGGGIMLFGGSELARTGSMDSTIDYIQNVTDNIYDFMNKE